MDPTPTAADLPSHMLVPTLLHKTFEYSCVCVCLCIIYIYVCIYTYIYRLHVSVSVFVSQKYLSQALGPLDVTGRRQASSGTGGSLHQYIVPCLKLFCCLFVCLVVVLMLRLFCCYPHGSGGTVSRQSLGELGVGVQGCG